MRLLNSFVIALAMYSKIPMPAVPWTKENMRFVMCFFPVIGLIIGASVYAWAWAGTWLSLGRICYTSILLLIPVLLTGGIHLDGLLDTADALSSYQSKEKRLAILKDSHAGAFAIIVGLVYFMAYFGFLSEIRKDILPLYCLSFCLSRILSGLSVTLFPCAKESGLARTFADGADKKRTRLVLAGEGVVTAVLLICIQPFLGSCVLAAALLVFFYYYRMSVKKFGGITGDLAGYFLQLSELFMLIVMVIARVVLVNIGAC